MTSAPPRLVVHVESPNRGQQGDSVYRTVQPCRALGELPGVTVVSGSVLSPALAPLLPEADVLVLCDVVDVDLVPVIAARRARGLVTIYEINDDFLSPQPWSPTAYLAKNLVMRSLSSRLAAGSDGVQVTVPELARRFARLGPPVRVFRNHLWELPPAPSRAERSAVRIGWGGSVGHREDVRATLPAVARVLARHPEASFASMGDAIYRDLAAQALPAGRWEHVPAGSLAEYYRFVGGLDVGIAPLLETDFNLCRSDVKFLEYAAHEVVPVCADLPPYRDSVRVGETGYLFDSPETLEARLEAVLRDEQARRRVGVAARRYVANERLEGPHALDRWRFYEEQARALGYTWAPSGAAARLPAAISQEGRAFAPGAYFALGEGRVEALLYEGLLGLRDGQHELAARAFTEAARLAPAFHLPHLHLGAAARDPQTALEHLATARALAPASVAALLLAADRLIELGRVGEAKPLLERCAALAPGLGVAEARLGELAEGAGDPTTAVSLYQQAFAANPFFAPPALRLAQHALSAGRLKQAEGILNVAIERDDRLVATQLLLGRVLVEQGRFAEARRPLARALERAEDPVPVLAQLAKAELGLGHVDAAKAILAELKRRTA